MVELNFLTRQEWAQSRRSTCKDRVSTRIADYATEAEIAALKAALVNRWKEVGKDNRGEDLRWKRMCIKSAINLVKKGQIPLYATSADVLLAPFHARYEAAKAELVSDEVWAKELERRANLEARYGSAK